ncbi:hypothetical protein MNEG_0343 [Monoraphidium neglectum]|uniref:CRAL-TRIO domain-containing protein n=1 Tax=Monoraphidium neglectum TaxID=145388 RepID=A0A0D2KBY8_9CHLO|nr:hypothetical protein MNEG_0343 [Monoraphidium neglectum]KIZ07613.1 hypothetical protein MNEG_0343 [Monoraphidium neglectum]|eukprot:XP_013906632.1 hypothetical protein MNEG_0343 [Monoraphidium neglectum]
MLTGFAQRLFRALTAMDSDNYPETCHQIFIVNNSAAFSAIWRMVKVFVDQGTRDKVKVLGSGNPMLVALLQEFDAAQIPSFLGGALDYDERRRQWMETMDLAMAEAAAAAAARAAKAPAGGGGGSGAVNGFDRMPPPVRTSVAASQRSESVDDADGFATPVSAASRISSAMSVYFDAIDHSSPSVTSTPGQPSSAAPAGSAASGESPGGSPPAPGTAGAALPPPVLAGGGGSPGVRGGGGSPGGRGGGGFDAPLPQYHPQTSHHVQRASTLTAVPSGELPPGTEPQPKCCVIS